MTKKILKTNYRHGNVDVYKHENSDNPKNIENGTAKLIESYSVIKYTIKDFYNDFYKNLTEQDQFDYRNSDYYCNYFVKKNIMELFSKSIKGYIWKIVRTDDNCGDSFDDEYHLTKKEAIVYIEDNATV